jgi:hypothetical protein
LTDCWQALDLPLLTLPELRYDEELNDYRGKLRQARNYNLKHANYNYYFTRNVGEALLPGPGGVFPLILSNKISRY